MNPMDLKRGIDRAVKAIVTELKKNARKVATNVEIAQIGTISANGDPEIGRTIADAMDKVGNDGVITVEDGTSRQTEVEVVKGIQFDRSYISPHFITDRHKRVVEMEDAYILISEKKLSKLDHLLPLLEKIVQAEKPLLIVADEVEEVMAALVVNKRGSLKVAAVKAPAYGDLRKAIMQDIALLTGGTVISEDLGLKLETVSLDMLGRTKKVTIDKENTTIVGGAANRSDLEARVVELKARIKDANSDYDLESSRSGWPDLQAALPSSCRWGHRDRGEGEGSHPQRDERDQSRRRGGHPARRRCCPAACQSGCGKQRQ